MRNCERIQRLQRLHLTGRHDSVDVAIDYAEEGRFRILAPGARPAVIY